MCRAVGGVEPAGPRQAREKICWMERALCEVTQEERQAWAGVNKAGQRLLSIESLGRLELERPEQGGRKNMNSQRVTGPKEGDTVRQRSVHSEGQLNQPGQKNDTPQHLWRAGQTRNVKMFPSAVWSHRARLPASLALRLLPDDAASPRRFALNVSSGRWRHARGATGSRVSAPAHPGASMARPSSAEKREKSYRVTNQTLQRDQQG